MLYHPRGLSIFLLRSQKRINGIFTGTQPSHHAFALESLIAMEVNPMLRLTLAVIALFTLVACNTVEGFGQDVENTGDAIENEAS